MEWQTIDSAPKDGTWCLIYSPLPHFGRGSPLRVVMSRFVANRYWKGINGYALAPTHWMPLPQQPNTGE